MLAAEENMTLDPREIEVATFGADHCFIGYEVARHWNFPPSILEPVLHHHDPASYRGDDKKISLSTKSIYLSGLLLNILYSDKPEEYHKQFRTQAKSLLGLKSDDIEAILEAAHTAAFLELAV